MDLVRAQGSLRAAHLCLEQRLFDSAVNRAYFAMFQAAIATLEEQGTKRTEWTHKGVHKLQETLLFRGGAGYIQGRPEQPRLTLLHPTTLHAAESAQAERMNDWQRSQFIISRLQQTWFSR
jgi:hypothetical protein